MRTTVRLLFTFAGGRGHFDPLVPIARAAEAAGHIVAFSGEPAMAPAVEAAGFTVFPSGPNTSSTQRRPLLAVDMEREDRALRDGYAGRTARGRAAGILALCAEWQPDILVCDEIDFGTMVVGERLRLPYASVLVIATGAFVRKELVGQPLNELRGEHGLPPDPHLAMLSRYLVLSPFPASYRDPAFPLPATAHTFCPFAPDPAADAGAPPPAPRRLWGGGTGVNGAPIVYFTLGTVFNMESGDLFSRVLRVLRDLPINLVVTVGHAIAPEEFGPQPDNVHIERYIPQSSVMPHCDLVVCHGGSGSVGGALAHGRPMVLIPMGADQPLNAARCARLGLARVLDPLAATAESVREAVSAVLRDPSYRRAAEGMRDEIRGRPGPAHAVGLLETLRVKEEG